MKTLKNGQEVEVEISVGVVNIHTILMHESGQWIQSDLTIPCNQFDAQGIGSASTYGKRYAYQAMAGVATAEDDDGEGAVGRPPQGNKVPPQNQRQPPTNQNNSAPPKQSQEAADAAAFKILSEAAAKGIEELGQAWKAIGRAGQERMVNRKEELKAIAAEAEKKKTKTTEIGDEPEEMLQPEDMGEPEDMGGDGDAGTD